MCLRPRQADGEIHEDQPLNFVVNTLDEEVDLGLADNAEIEAEDIYEVLVGACADGTLVSELCGTSKDSPHQNTILYHLREKFDLMSVEQVGNALLQKDVLEVLPEQVEVVSDSTCGPTMATRMRQMGSITRKRSVEPPHSMLTRHCTRV